METISIIELKYDGLGRPLCPQCGTPMKRSNHRHPQTYECPNPKCDVIDLRIFYRVKGTYCMITREARPL